MNETNPSSVKLYDSDSYLQNFTATVLECIALADMKENPFSGKKHSVKNPYCLILDQSGFFPEEGGQYSDTGTLRLLSDEKEHSTQENQDIIAILDVQLQQGILYHLSDGPIPAGSGVLCEIHFAERFDKMQQHSGEHILSGLIFQKYGFHNVGFHLGADVLTMDVDGLPTASELNEIELLANRIVQEDVPISISYPTKEELKNIEYRSKIEIPGQVRLVTIGSYDICACCAPHVSSTGQIGLIKILRFEHLRGGTRITVLCGMRAVTELQKKNQALDSLSSLLSVPYDKALPATEALKKELADVKYRKLALEEELLRMKVKEAESHGTNQEKNAASADISAENILFFISDVDTIAIRNTVNELMKAHHGYSAIFSGSDNDGYRFLIGSSAKDCRLLSTFLKTSLNAKGGGSESMVQGSLNATETAIREKVSAFLSKDFE